MTSIFAQEETHSIDSPPSVQRRPRPAEERETVSSRSQEHPLQGIQSGPALSLSPTALGLRENEDRPVKSSRIDGAKQRWTSRVRQ